MEERDQNGELFLKEKLSKFHIRPVHTLSRALQDAHVRSAAASIDRTQILHQCVRFPSLTISQNDSRASWKLSMFLFSVKRISWLREKLKSYSQSCCWIHFIGFNQSRVRRTCVGGALVGPQTGNFLLGTLNSSITFLKIWYLQILACPDV